VGGLGGLRRLGGLGDEWDRWDRWDEWDKWDRWDKWDKWDEWDKWENYSVIVRSLFAHCSLIVYSSYIVLFVFLIFTSSNFFILLSDFDCISIC